MRPIVSSPKSSPASQINPKPRFKIPPRLLIVLSLLVVFLSWFEYLDQAVTNYLTQVMGEALIAFGSSKVIMAAVSLLKNIEISLGFGVGASMHPFAFLEPLAEVADDYGDLMRVALVSLITQIFLLKIVSSIYFKILVSAAGLVFLCSWRWPAVARFLGRLFVFSVFLRFAVVLAVGLSLGLNNLILQKPLDERLEKVTIFAEQIDVLESTSALSAEERAALKLAIEGRNLELDMLVESLANLEQRLEAEQETLTQLEAKLTAKKEQLSLVEKVFSDNPEFLALRKQTSAQRQLMQKIQLEQRQLIQKAMNLESLQKQEEDELAGVNLSWWQSIKTSAENLTQTILQIKDKVQQVYDNFGNLAVDMMYVMAAFLLRTLIMPLVFLYALLKAFRLIWQKDLTQVWQTTKQEVRQELRL